MFRNLKTRKNQNKKNQAQISVTWILIIRQYLEHFQPIEYCKIPSTNQYNLRQTRKIIIPTFNLMNLKIKIKVKLI